MSTLVATSGLGIVEGHWCRSVEMALRQESQTDWAFADAVFDDVLDEVAANERDASRSAEHGVHTGIHQAVDVVFDYHRKAGTEVTRSTIYDMFVTVRVWPDHERLPDLASFSVHKELRSKEYPNRRALIAKHAARSSTGRWTMPDLRRWKSERKPPAQKSFLELVDGRVRAALKAAAQPWHTVAQDDREAIARLLRVVAEEVESGEFPK